MGMAERLDELERRHATDRAPLTMEEYLKWGRMFAEERTGQMALYEYPGRPPVVPFTAEDWTWYREHEKDFEQTYAILVKAGIVKG